MAAKRIKMNEQDSGVEVVRGCLTEGGNSILGVFFREPAFASEATRQVYRVSWLAD